MIAFNPSESQLRDYVQEKLDDKQTEQIELWLLDHPEALGDLEMDVMLFQAEFDPAALSTEKKLSHWHWLATLLQNNKLIPVHVFAYGLAFLFVFSSLFPISPKKTQAAATFIELEKQRGMDADIISVNPINNTLVIRFFPDSMQQEYQLTMSSIGGNQSHKYKDLKADDFGSITLALQDVEKGQWIISIADASNNTEQEYKIDVN